VDNLQAVPFRQVGFRPLFAGNDASVQLDGNAICFHSQLIYEASECKGRIEIASLAIDLQFHVIWIFAAASANGN
jgi:hypothetical protein